MTGRQPLPRLWLMTDERLGDALWTALHRLPRRSGIVFRHYSLPRGERRLLFEQVRAVARRRGHLLLLAGDARTARGWRADGSHGRGRGAGLRTSPAHSLREVRAAERAGAALLFVSPVFETRSHPNTPPLGRTGFHLLAAATQLPVIALGGMDAQRARGLHGIYGWAAIAAWSDQKRNAVPR